MRKDIIYRDDAIEAIHKEARLAGGSVAIQYADMFQEALLGLSSVQLETNCSEIPNNSDTISRQAAIKELESGKDKKAKGEIGGFYNQIIENDIEKLRKLPSARSERDISIKPTEVSEMICDAPVIRVYCPRCNHKFRRVYIGDNNISFCENCGQAIDWKEWESEE